MHDLGYFTACDSKGVTRLVCGPFRGAANDIGIWYGTQFRHEIGRYFGRHKVLFDSIYRFVDNDE